MLVFGDEDVYLRYIQLREKDPFISAMHEAGHATVGFLLKRKFSYVSIIKSNPMDETLGGDLLNNNHLTLYKSRNKHAKIKKDIQLLQAGDLSEQLYLHIEYSLKESSKSKDTYFVSKGKNNLFTEDDQKVNELRRSINLAEEDINLLHYKTALMVWDNFYLIQALGISLVQEHKIEYLRVKDIFANAKAMIGACPYGT